MGVKHFDGWCYICGASAEAHTEGRTLVIEQACDHELETGDEDSPKETQTQVAWE
jgi:hypothetical protein